MPSWRPRSFLEVPQAGGACGGEWEPPPRRGLDRVRRLMIQAAQAAAAAEMMEQGGMAGFEMLLELPVELLEHVVQAAVEKAWSAVQSAAWSAVCSLAALQSCSRAAVQPWSAEELRCAAVRPWSPEEDEELSVAGRLGLTVAELWVVRCVQPCSLVEQTRRMLGWRSLPRPPEGRRCVAW